MVMILGENMLNGFLSKLTECPRNISIGTKRLIWFDISFFFPSKDARNKKKNQTQHIFVFKVVPFRQ